MLEHRSGQVVPRLTTCSFQGTLRACRSAPHAAAAPTMTTSRSNLIPGFPWLCPGAASARLQCPTRPSSMGQNSERGEAKSGAGAAAANVNRVARPPRSSVGDDGWWASHWESAPAEIEAFLGEVGIQLAGAAVADFGCGDGIMAGGLAWRTGASVVGFDLDPTDSAALEIEAKVRGFDLSAIDVEFRGTEAGAIDARDGEFDLGVSWSVLEHVFDRVGYMKEARRVIKPYGHFLVQVWPLWHSEHGHHLWQWLNPFDHLRLSRDEIIERLQGLERLPVPVDVPGGTAVTLSEYLRAWRLDRDEWMSQAMASYDSCSRITLDEIQTLLVEHGFCIARFEFMTGQFHVPDDLQSIPLTLLSPNGFKLIAWRKP